MKEMKFRIGSYDVSIKAKNRILSEKANERDTMHLMNILSIILEESARLFKMGHQAEPEKEFLARMAVQRQHDSDEIYDQLNALGFYEEANNL